MRLTISAIPTTAASPTGPVTIQAYQFAVPIRLIIVYPDNVPFAPRLPVLGLRTLVRNNVEIVIRGKDVIITP